jgi:hypothetical protein
MQPLKASLQTIKAIRNRPIIRHNQSISAGGTSVGFSKQIFRILMKFIILLKCLEEAFFSLN